MRSGSRHCPKLASFGLGPHPELDQELAALLACDLRLREIALSTTARSVYE